MVISELKWTKRTRLAVAVLCVALGTAGLVVLSQMNQVAEAAILTPIPSTPQTVFYDDFSGDLSQWNFVSGTWAIEGEELSQNETASGYYTAYAGASWTDVIVEAKVKLIGGHAFGAVLARYVDASNYYRLNIRTDSDRVQLAMMKNGVPRIIDEKAFTPSLGIWYELRLEIVGSTLRGYVDDVEYVSGTNEEFASGCIGLNTFASHVHFDDVVVSGVGISTVYSVNVRARATQILVTCTWSGPGNITIQLTSPREEIYNESNMNLYEKTMVDTKSQSIFNIKRAQLSITAPTSLEIWTLDLTLSDVTNYQVSVEIS